MAAGDSDEIRGAGIVGAFTNVIVALPSTDKSALLIAVITTGHEPELISPKQAREGNVAGAVYKPVSLTVPNAGDPASRCTDHLTLELSEENCLLPPTGTVAVDGLTARPLGRLALTASQTAPIPPVMLGWPD